MGITDRRYMSDEEGAESFGTVRGRPISATLLLIFINVAVWIVWQIANASPGSAFQLFMRENFLCGPREVLEQYRVWTLLTSEFSHIDATHIFFNLLFLWILAKDVEVFYGRNNFIALYVIAGLSASGAYVLIEVLRGQSASALGASGAVMGLAAAAACIDPLKKVNVMGIVPVPLWVLVPLYVALDLFGVVQSGDHVAHAAHLGGALAGFLFYVLDLRIFASRGRRSSGMLYRVRQWWRRRKFRSIEGGRSASSSEIPQDDREGELVASRRTRSERAHAAEQRRQAESAARIDPETARRVDELLAKISREGMGALSSEEQDFLKRSSQKYKK
ncbi:MAG TPA: rhomboid family intramembrane serine protease [Planctomycetota bacterium]|nr:rhomboid family intramembrane serine protease [Planctomycetota bacterium]